MRPAEDTLSDGLPVRVCFWAAFEWPLDVLLGNVAAGDMLDVIETVVGDWMIWCYITSMVVEVVVQPKRAT